MATRVIQKKFVEEALVISSDFSDRLAVGESVNAASSVILVFSGTDPDPELVLSGAATLANNVISQLVIDGLPGVIYKVLMTATTTAGNILINELKLAVTDVVFDVT